MSTADPYAKAQAWLSERGPRAVVIPHGDPDGLAAGAILARSACGGVLHVETPWEGALPANCPAVVADWGVRRVADIQEALFVDHHADPEPVEGLVLRAGDTGDPATSTLAWRLLEPPRELAWLAALGVIGELGAGALRRDDVPRVSPVRALRRLTVLISAAGRLRGGPSRKRRDVGWLADAENALERHEVRQLQDAHRAVDAHRRAAMRRPPPVGRRAALVLLDVPARVHSQVAAAWTHRLAPRIVVVANAGVYEPPAAGGDYARGNARATGGSLEPAVFEQFAAAVLK